jgi:hypothetical protein
MQSPELPADSAVSLALCRAAISITYVREIRSRSALDLKSQRQHVMTIADFEPNLRGKHLTTVLRRVSGPIGAARDGVATLVARVPATVNATRSGARATTSALQTLPDSTLRSLAATSIGLGGGLYLAGKNRLAVAAGVGPALVMGAAIVLRPARPSAQREPRS